MCFSANKLLVSIVDANGDDSASELQARWTSARKAAAKADPAIAALPRGVSTSTFHRWLSCVAYPRGRTPTIRLKSTDLPLRVAFATAELSHPDHATDALFVKNTLHRSLAADGFSYDHNDVMRKFATGYVSGQRSRCPRQLLVSHPAIHSVPVLPL